MSDDIAQQLKERIAREQARHDRQTGSKEEKMEIDNTIATTNTDANANANVRSEEYKTEDSINATSRIYALQEILKRRQQTIDQMSQQIQDLQRKLQEENMQYQKEQQELNRLTNSSNNDNDVPMRESIQTSLVGDSDVSSSNTNANTDTNHNARQIMTDEELARHLAAQFEREEQEEQELEREQELQRRQQQEEQQEERQEARQRNAQSRSSNALNTSVRSYTFGDPNSGGFSVRFSSSSSSDDGHPMSSHPFGPMGFGIGSFFNNDDPFNNPLFMRNRAANDPFSRMRIHPRTLFPGLMFGGALMDEDTDYETLMHLFPPVPRGANQNDIQQLPEDVYRPKPTVQSRNRNEQKEAEIEKEDEFHKCCICLETFKEGELIRRLPCMHIFHKQEIDNWLKRNHLCPICRTPIEHNDPEQPNQ